MLLPMKDGGITDIRTDSNYYLGCSTCNYGSCYINEFTIYLTTGKIEVKCSQMYEYPFQSDTDEGNSDEKGGVI